MNISGITNVPTPINEPVQQYAPGSAQRERLARRVKDMATERIDLPGWIDGKAQMFSGEKFTVVQPHAHRSVLGDSAGATAQDAQRAIAAAKKAAPAWRDLSYDDRAAVFLRAADLLAGPWRDTLNAATMLGQSKTVIQAEIDAACELIDFWRYNVAFGRQLLAEQPISSPGVWNRTDHRPLEGFVYAITPFNFTAIAGNLPTAPALMGNTVVWKPAHTQMLSAHYLMELLRAAGLPDGVINMLPGDGKEVSKVVLADPDLAGIHFTGSTPVFQYLWKEVGNNIANYRTYPRLVGETGGKDFIVAHPSADIEVLKTAMIRGAYEYQGQKCSAASRAYVPASLWKSMKDDLVTTINSLTQGPTTDFSVFMSAVIDAKSFARVTGAIDRAKAAPDVQVIAGGTYDDSEGYFIRPTLLESANPALEYFCEEYFGPVLAVHVYDDDKYQAMLTQMESAAPYGLTGSIIAQDRAAIAHAMHYLRFAAGNFYINDKPTGAVVGQQPFGGGRASGTNDKAGALQNLLRWTSTRSIKETLVPPTHYAYPHMD